MGARDQGVGGAGGLENPQLPGNQRLIATHVGDAATES
jgi:hypothetical protein